MNTVRHHAQQQRAGNSCEQIRLIPDPLTPHQVAARRAKRTGKAIEKYGLTEWRHNKWIEALYEVIDTAVIGRGMNVR